MIKEDQPVIIITEDALAEALLTAVAPSSETLAEKRKRYVRLVAAGDLTAEEADQLRRSFATPGAISLL